LNILVTGAAGFIGTHLVKRLWDDGHRVTRLDVSMMGISTERSAAGHMVVTCPPVDIRDDRVMKQHEDISAHHGGHDACVHLAALATPWRCGEDPSTAYETNVRGTANVLGLCRRLGVRRVIFPSSAHVYGISPLYLPTGETHPLALLDTYTTTKILGEQLCDLYWRNHHLSYCVLRLFNVYGQGQNADFFLGAKLAQAKTGRLTIRTKLADVTKDWVHVRDIVDAMVLALQSDHVGPLNLGTGREVSLREITDRIGEAFGIRHVVGESTEDGGPSRMCADIRRAKAVLGWEPKVRFEDGLAEMIGASR
jgi:UDP-glucose 4-epimerase